MDLTALSQERIIDGVTYRCWPIEWGAMRPITVRLLKIVAPGIAAAFRALGDDTKATTEQQRAKLQEQFADGLAAVIAKVEDADIATMSTKFGDNSAYQDGDKWPRLLPVAQNFHFAGRPDTFMQWLFFAMEVNGVTRFLSMMKDEAEGAMMTPTTPASPG